jgi:drug/metabolite transporter (DMT)-like permease
MFAVTLAFLASVLWGSADFIGGLTTRSCPLSLIVSASQMAGLVFLGVVALAFRGGPVTGHLALWAVIAGIALVVALSAFYRGMAVGVISLIAPIAAAGGCIPLAVGLASGERPSLLSLIGIGLVLTGAVIAAAEVGDAGLRLSQGMPLAVVAACGSGVFLFALKQASEPNQAISAAFFARLVSATIAVTVALEVRRRFGTGTRLRPLRVPIAVIGLSDAGATVLFAVATTRGLLSVVSVVGSSYPVTTILLARRFLGEELKSNQRIGVSLVIAGSLLTPL